MGPEGFSDKAAGFGEHGIEILALQGEFAEVSQDLLPFQQVLDQDFVRLLDHVIIGHDKPVFRDHEARAQRIGAALAR